MDKEPGTAMYLAGHGSKIKPRLVELQYERIRRYRHALLKRREINTAPPTVFIDLHLPSFGTGTVDLNQVPAFTRLHKRVQNNRYDVVFIDLDEVRVGLTPDYESAFVRTMLETAGAKVFNAFTTSAILRPNRHPQPFFLHTPHVPPSFAQCLQ